MSAESHEDELERTIADADFIARKAASATPPVPSTLPDPPSPHAPTPQEGARPGDAPPCAATAPAPPAPSVPLTPPPTPAPRGMEPDFGEMTIVGSNRKSDAATDAPRLLPRSSTGVELILVQDTIIVGRSDEATLNLQDRSVSRSHARIEHRPDGFHVTDLGSSAGTKVNGTKVEHARIRDGDLISFGDVPYLFRWPADPMAPGGESTKDPGRGASKRRRAISVVFFGFLVLVAGWLLFPPPTNPTSSSLRIDYAGVWNDLDVGNTREARARLQGGSDGSSQYKRCLNFCDLMDEVREPIRQARWTDVEEACARMEKAWRENPPAVARLRQLVQRYQQIQASLTRAIEDVRQLEASPPQQQGQELLDRLKAALALLTDAKRNLESARKELSVPEQIKNSFLFYQEDVAPIAKLLTQADDLRIGERETQYRDAEKHYRLLLANHEQSKHLSEIPAYEQLLSIDRGYVATIDFKRIQAEASTLKELGRAVGFVQADQTADAKGVLDAALQNLKNGERLQSDPHGDILRSAMADVSYLASVTDETNDVIQHILKERLETAEKEVEECTRKFAGKTVQSDLVELQTYESELKASLKDLLTLIRSARSCSERCAAPATMRTQIEARADALAKIDSLLAQRPDRRLQLAAEGVRGDLQAALTRNVAEVEQATKDAVKQVEQVLTKDIPVEPTLEQGDEMARRLEDAVQRLTDPLKSLQTLLQLDPRLQASKDELRALAGRVDKFCVGWREHFLSMSRHAPTDFAAKYRDVSDRFESAREKAHALFEGFEDEK